MKCNRTKEREAYFSLRKLPATILGLAEVTATICAQGMHPSTCFSRLLLQFSFFFLVLQALGHPTLPSPVFWYLDFDSCLSTCIAYKLSCLNWACCAQVFYAAENVCRLSFAILYRYIIQRIHCSNVLFLVQSLTKREFTFAH